MEVIAQAKFIRISPKKVRPLLKDLRSKPVVLALSSLRYAHTKAGRLLYKLVHSAAANASNNYNLKLDNLRIKSITANDGPRLKRYWFRSHGSADVILKRNAHLKVILEEIKVLSPAIASPKSGAKLVATPAEPTASPSAQSAKTEVKPMADKAKSAKSAVTKLKRIFRRTSNK